MKQSKIQLVELNLVRLALTANSRFKNSISTDEIKDADLVLQSAKTIHKFPGYWEEEKVADSVKNHTYSVRLGIRTQQGEKNGYPYQFEVMYSGVVINFDATDGNPDELAVKYGLALLYGAVRDQVLSLTGKMKHGVLLLPTMSFEDEKYEELAAAHEKLIKRAVEKELPSASN